MDLTWAAHEGSSIENVEPLEKQLQAAPDDLTLRAKILGHYHRRARLGSAERRAHVEHVLWFVEHAPTCELVGTPPCSLHVVMDSQAIPRARALWQRHLDANPKDLALLDRAASFLLFIDRKASARLWARAVRLAPKEPRFRDRLGHLHSLNANGAPPARRKAEARKALAAYEAARRLTRRAESRFYQLDELAISAFDAGRLDKATRYAQEAIRCAAAFRNDWNHGNALHHGHQVLGRVALKKGRLAKAKQELFASAQTPGSPQLDSFGPSFALARELAEEGEWEAVAAYLEEVGRFWEMGKGALAKWAADVAAQRVPDFDQPFLYV